MNRVASYLCNLGSLAQIKGKEASRQLLGYLTVPESGEGRRSFPFPKEL